ncbi:MAG: O-antigen ligase family protein [Lachnospiraceae bacterium]|nr:O-antigen ligase family protein [Lachnospiraceae bacterium]
MGKKRAKNTNRNSSKVKIQKTLHQTVSSYLQQFLVAAYVFLLLCVYPLFYDTGVHGRYFNMGETKYAFFKWVSLVGLPLIAAAFLYHYLSHKKDEDFLREARRYSGVDLFAAAFLGISMLSYIFSSYKEVALWGYKGWYMGVMSQLAFVMIYFFVSRAWKWSPYTFFSMAGAAAVCFQIGILQRFCFNPLGLYDHVKTEDMEKFLSTLGQTSWYSSYAILVVPFGLYFYWIAEQHWTRILAGSFVALGFGMVCTTNSDSIYVALVLILMVFFRYSLESNQKLARFLEIGLIGLASFKMVGWMRVLYPERQRTYITGEEKITKFITSSPWMLALLILLAGVYIAFRILALPSDTGAGQKGKTFFEIAKYKTWIWSATVTMAVLVIWGVLMMILLVTNGKVQFGGETGFFYFGESWGNHRGFNWRMAARAITNASIKDLLIGVGPDCFDGAMDTYCAEEVNVYWHGLSLACAHNEWLNMLVTEGVLGLAAYLGIFIAMFRRACRAVTKEPVLIAFMGAIAAYIGHNIFCYQQCVCTPVIFILLGMTEMICRAAEKAKGK